MNAGSILRRPLTPAPNAPPHNIKASMPDPTVAGKYHVKRSTPAGGMVNADWLACLCAFSRRGAVDALGAVAPPGGIGWIGGGGGGSGTSWRAAKPGAGAIGGAMTGGIGAGGGGGGGTIEGITGDADVTGAAAAGPLRPDGCAALDTDLRTITWPTPCRVTVPQGGPNPPARTVTGTE